jgi:hypothetical protein
VHLATYKNEQEFKKKKEENLNKCKFKTACHLITSFAAGHLHRMNKKITA